MNKYQLRLEERKAENLLRILPNLKEGIDFYSNDYLGLSSNTSLKNAIHAEVEENITESIGATGSRLLSGNSAYAEQLEADIAAFHGAEAALLFNSGFMANVGLLSCIARQEDTLMMDELIHASMIDGARLSKAKSVWFRHNDLQDLEEKLRLISGNKIVVAESIYSMDGDICPLRNIVTLCEQYDAHLIVDEAHGIGVMGKRGEGLVSQLDLTNKLLGTVVTFGKAMGGHGAAILGKKWLKEYLTNFSRPFIFTTGPSFHQLSSIKCAYQYLAKANEERRQLQLNIDYLNSKKSSSPFEWLPSKTAIQAVIIPGNANVMQAARHLQHNGIQAMGIRYPSVAQGTERIRICLHAYNTFEQIDYLLNQLTEFSKENSLFAYN